MILVLAVHTDLPYVAMLLGASTILSGLAVFFQFYKYQESIVIYRRLRIVRGIIAAAYTVLQLALLFDFVPLHSYADIARGLGLLAWPAVWILPTFLERRMMHALNVVINETLEDQLDEVEE